MTDEILNELKANPQEILKASRFNEFLNFFKHEIKELLDPLARSYSPLDEIHVNGLDAIQIYSQAKIILDSIDESLLFDRIPQFKEKHGLDDSSLKNENGDGSTSLSDTASEATDMSILDKDENHDSDSASDIILQSNKQNDDEGEEKSDSSDYEEESVSQVNQKVALNAEPRRLDENDSELNDEFFDIEAFNRQILALENDRETKSDEEVDYFGDVGDDEDEEMAYFDDFFDEPEVKPHVSEHRDAQMNNRDMQEDLSDVAEEEDFEKAINSAKLDLFSDAKEDNMIQKNLSSFEKQQQKIQAEISRLESELVAEKKWTMKGEVSLKDRPQGALMDDNDTLNLDFERNSKPIPVITDEVTSSIEDLIRSRIKEENFDDLQRRHLNDMNTFKRVQKAQVSEEKSKKSLAEVYEDAYNNYDENKEASEELLKHHDEIANLFQDISRKLDSLSSAHFIVRPHKPTTVDVKITEIPKVTLENAQPLHVASGSTIAPQEVYRIGDDAENANVKNSEVFLKSGLSYSKDELSKDEKLRLRRANKRKNSKKFKEKKRVREEQDKSNNVLSKKHKIGEVVNTLASNSNITLVNKKGEFTDVKGNLKGTSGKNGSSSFRL